MSSNGTPWPCLIEPELEGVWDAPSAGGDSGGAYASAGRGGT